MEAINLPSPPHVLIFPCPAQGHVNVMLKLAELLSLAGLHVTFLNCENIHDRLLRFTNIESRFKKYPGFRLEKIPDGMPENHSRDGDKLFEILNSMRLVSSKILKQMLVETKPPITCVISDGILGFVLDVAVEVGIPVIYFRTISSSCMWVYFCLQDLIQAGELPIRGEEDMDRLITKVPGMEGFLRCRDLPSFCRVSDMSDIILQHVMKETHKASGARALILNTFEELEGPFMAHIRTRCPTIYSIGPIHQNLKLKLKQESNDDDDDDDNDDHSSNNNNLWAVDRTSIDWLDNQPPKSVIYVSFGSITLLTREQLFEFWYGLVNSKKRFLWVMRPGSIIKAHEAQEGIPAELEVGTRERGCMVGWVPQEEVLAHKAVGGFLTHNGWNSTLESIAAGVPMICWPYFADQQVNSRFASEVWGLGLDMKDVCDRNVVEKMVNDLMVDRKDEFERSARKMEERARRSVSEGGSSCRNLECLIEDIKKMS